MARMTSQLPLAALGNLQNRSQTRDALIEKAGQQAPDQQLLTQQLLQYDLTPVEYQNAAMPISQEVGNFMGNLDKDPFYSFSNEGRKTVRNIQQMVNNPVLKNAEAMYGKAKEVFAANQDVADEFVINDGRVKMLKRDDQGNMETKWAYLNELDGLSQEGYRPLKVNDERALIESPSGIGVVGYAKLNNGRMPEYNMVGIQELEQRLRRDINTGLGSTGRTSQSGFDSPWITTTQSQDNAAQIQERIIGVMNNLNDTDRNTLMSQYLKEEANAPTNEGFSEWVMDRMEGYASGARKTVFAQKRDLNPMAALQAKNASKSGSGGPGGVKPLTIVNSIVEGKFGNKPVTLGRVPMNAVQAPHDALADATGTKEITNNNNERVTSRKLADLNYLKPTLRGNTAVFDSKGQLHKLNGAQVTDFYNNSYLSEENLDIVLMPVSPDGEPIPMEVANAIEEYDRFIKMYGTAPKQTSPELAIAMQRYKTADNTFRREWMFRGNFVAPDNIEGPLKNNFKDYGIANHNANVSQFNTYVEKGSDKEVDSNLFSTDNVFEGQFVVPISSLEELARAAGQQTYAPTSEFMAGTVGQGDQDVKILGPSTGGNYTKRSDKLR